MTDVFSNLSDNLRHSLTTLGITSPTPVQAEVIPRILEGENVLFESETGTGKTFAYLLPLINKLESIDDHQRVRIIVVAPTFELASQINSACKSVTTHKSALMIGGAPLKRQIETLKEKPEIIIGTAARLVELIHLKKLKIEGLFAAVFDETDRLVKKESVEDTSNFRNLLPAGTQIIACTATISKQTKIFFADAKNVVMPPEDVLRKRITHWAIYAEARDKIETLRKFLSAENPTKALIFTSRADQVENIYNKLREPLHFAANFENVDNNTFLDDYDIAYIYQSDNSILTSYNIGSIINKYDNIIINYLKYNYGKFINK